MLRRDDQGHVPPAWYAVLALGVVAIALAGYLGFRIYPRAGLPDVEGAALLALAAAAGIAAFFSPCSFPLLATILSREVGVDAATDGVRARDALRYAFALSIGTAAFLLIAGLVVGVGGDALVRAVTFGSPAARVIRTFVGLFLLAMAAVQLGVIHVPAFHRVDALVRPLQRRQAELRRQQPDLGYALFGFGYVFAGFG